MSPFDPDEPDIPNDLELEAVAAELLSADPDGSRMAEVFRSTFDQLYDGQRTGRYRWDQLFKTEKTHYGTLIEINLQREFGFDDGQILDYAIAGYEVDSKYSATAQWMLPPESINHLILGSVASDERSVWSIGLVRATPENRNVGMNRDQKGSLNALGKSRIKWLFRDAPMQPNILIQLPTAHIARIFAPRSGQARVNELFRVATNMRISRNIIATVAQQDDFMKRVRENGGARSVLRSEGYLILGGDYTAQTAIARSLGCTVPEPGELVSIRVGPVDFAMANSVNLEGRYWRHIEGEHATTTPAPKVLAQ
ncbi:MULTISPECIES: NaeI family type II restriction endonuclease [unclassified Arthrobacter]|uniref:NaeI family type II restriction endonuclease n=1 Tax=unclassified Arthrobacter TaxID=235627 RepID=UPI001CFFCB98|nr:MULTISPECIES: NaeI family type II restriction endonuclease [unclassified Arthrobacter]MCB5281389.1 Type-2 restriction enzyme NaeI [Arthrobacter sp. ES1]WGZ80119.1 NaeI family type II restriction endonuclease [Arthrobacter sp. EM1]